MGEPLCVCHINTIFVFNEPSRLTQPGRPFGVGAMSSSRSCRVHRHTTWCTSHTSMVSQCKLVSDWRLRD